MKNYKRTKFACYYTYLSMASVFSLPPLLFNTFHEMYNISYTLLGSLVAINFCTQLAIDLIFTFFSSHFNIKKTVTVMPLITSFGLLVYCIVPWLFPQYAFLGLVIGTCIFSVSAGLSEVLLSPVVAAIPSKTPEKDMSMLHSLYAYGVVSIVIISTLFFALFDTTKWIYLAMLCSVLPIGAFLLFLTSPMPDVIMSSSDNKGDSKGKNLILSLCVLCIFFGSAAENSMTNWISSFVESSLNLPKTYGDILGMALFAIFLGITRTAYAKFGKNIYKVLLVGMAGSVVCYIVAGISSVAFISLAACILTGVCTAMLWPGTLIFMEEKLTHIGVAAYALLAAGGDFGASVAPQLVGVVIDKTSASEYFTLLADKLSLTPDQIGLKCGMLVAAVFPLLGTVVLIITNKKLKHKGRTV